MLKIEDLEELLDKASYLEKIGYQVYYVPYVVDPHGELKIVTEVYDLDYEAEIKDEI